MRDAQKTPLGQAPPMAILKKFWSFIGVALFLFAVFWLPKDLADTNQAIEPWKRIISMVDQNTALWSFALFALAYIFWMDARPFVMAYLGGRKSAKALEKSHVIPDVRAADSKSVRNLLNGDERTKFVALLQSGGITAWARNKNSVRRDLSSVKNETWRIHTIEFVDINNKQQTLVADPTGIKKYPWSKDVHEPDLTHIYDIHFNRSQLKSIWPTVSF
jgi:hypothetical protein